MLACIGSAGIRSAGRHVYVDLYMYTLASCHPANLLTGLIMYKGLYIHLSVWIYKWVGRYHGGRWPGKHVYIDLYMWLPADPSTYLSS